MDICVLAVVLTACTVLLVTLFSKKGEQKPAHSRYAVRTNGDEEFYREGPAWQVFEVSAIQIPQEALCRATCWIYRIGGIDETRLQTDFFGPFGAGTALHAKVKIGGEFREDLYVGTRPLKGSLPICPVNWERMTLTEVSIDPESCRYDAVLEMSTHEAARHDDLSQKLM